MSSISQPPPPKQGQQVSLYQQCFILTEQLYSIQGIERYLFPGGVPEKSSALDPISTLWHAFRLGYPLVKLVYLIKESPAPSFDVEASLAPGNGYSNNCKKAIYHFLVTCKTDLMIPEDELFKISELYKDDTNGFVQVCRIRAIHLVNYPLGAENGQSCS